MGTIITLRKDARYNRDGDVQQIASKPLGFLFPILLNWASFHSDHRRSTKHYVYKCRLSTHELFRVKLLIANWICDRRHQKHSICGSLSIWNSYKIYDLNDIENQSRALWTLHWTLHTSTHPGLDQASIYVINHSVCLRIHTHTNISF